RDLDGLTLQVRANSAEALADRPDVLGAGSREELLHGLRRRIGGQVDVDALRTPQQRVPYAAAHQEELVPLAFEALREDRQRGIHGHLPRHSNWRWLWTASHGAVSRA